MNMLIKFILKMSKIRKDFLKINNKLTVRLNLRFIRNKTKLLIFDSDGT